MDPIARNLVKVQIEDEMRSSYLDYSMSVIIGRALPDVRDGLKPVHRRILYAMFREGLLSNRRYSKCAGVVGEVLKKYHPHGDNAVYDALVRMAQPWNLRYLLVDGQGNFGSVDGDNAAAYRYTECRMTALAEELLADIDKETVDFGPNFDGSHEEPDVLPAAFPHLLVNGSEGIAVGMATKIPPHNLGEVIDGCVAMIDNPDITSMQLMAHVHGPDFPTHGIICGRAGIRDAYETGRGSLTIRGRVEYEDIDGREAIIVTELPYQVNKARFQEHIAELVREKRLEGIHGLRDETSREGTRVVIELKRDAIRDLVVNHLYKHTQLQTTFGIIMLAIVQQRPRVLPLRDMLQLFLSHRREVTVRRTRYELRKARERAHILEGLRIALDHIDAVIALIRASRTTEEARDGLMSTFGLSELQAQAILDMRLAKLTGLERDKLEEEYAELMRQVEYLQSLLDDEQKLWGVIRAELLEVKRRFGDARRTTIEEAASDLNRLDLVAEEDQIVTLSHEQYVKRTPLSEYRTQRRGGMGKTGMNAREGDFVKDVLVANTHGRLLVFTNTGRVFDLGVIDLPEAAANARGKPIQNLIPFAEGERVATVLPIRDFDEGGDLIFASKNGLVKRTELAAYGNVRSNGIIAVDVAEGDSLLGVVHASGDSQLLFATADGMSIRFRIDNAEDPESSLRPLGRAARGVRAIRLEDGDSVVDFAVCPPDTSSCFVLTVTERGYGKRTPLGTGGRTGEDEGLYPCQNRAGKGVIDIVTDERNGHVVGNLIVGDSEQVFLITDTGRAIRMKVSDVRTVGRNTKGVRLMRLDGDEKIVGLARVDDPGDDEAGETIEPPDSDDSVGK
ncbi:MAG: DNA gyrase subunit A [Deltaproteobacteria bacterium]|nr:DNA gyrase subunit A [Deltaproteobacteria bacterium]